MENLNWIYKNKRRLIALALSLTMFVSAGCSKDSKKDNLQISDYNTEFIDDTEKENRFIYYSYPNGYYFARNYNEKGRPFESWHAIKKSEAKNGEYDIVVESSVISNVITIINDESITYLVPKGFELRIFDGVLFGVPESENFTYENSSDLLLIEELSDGTKSYTIPYDFKMYENFNDNCISYNIEEKLVRKK